MSKQFLSRQMKPEHLKAVRSLGYALILGDYKAWAGLSVVLTARLEPEERAALAFMALKSLPCEKAAQTAAAVFQVGAGTPGAPFIDHDDQAVSWAQWADPDELDSYAVAIFSAMSDAKRLEFADFVRRAAA